MYVTNTKREKNYYVKQFRIKMLIYMVYKKFTSAMIKTVINSRESFRIIPNKYLKIMILTYKFLFRT